MPSNIQRWERAAEKIITGAGLTFALAAGNGNENDLRQARALLKEAIVRALQNETEFTVAAIRADVH